jgi:hypothetical protein
VQLLGALGGRLDELTAELCPPRAPAVAAGSAVANVARDSRGSGWDCASRRCGTRAEAWAAAWVPLAHALAGCTASAPDALAAEALEVRARRDTRRPPPRAQPPRAPPRPTSR